MGPLLRPRLNCFYCGRGSAQKKTPGLRKWQCERCLAENFLDENGDITDPPPSSTVAQGGDRFRYAHAVNRPSSPVFDKAPDSLFCATCLKNQRLLNESLAQYYPSPSKDSFQEYDQALPEYRARLEERYPQCCTDCEPRVRQRLKDASYAAKTDNMRRIMARTNSDVRFSGNSRGAMRVLVAMAGLMWTLSWLGQLTWDACGLLIPDSNINDLSDPDESIIQAFRRLVVDRKVSSKMREVLPLIATYSLVLGVLSVWWNPKLSRTISNKNAKAVGLAEYYKLQALGIIIRVCCWYWISTTPQADTNRAIHSFTLILSIPVLSWLLQMVRLDTTPRIIYKESPNSLLVQPQALDSNSNHLPPTNIRNGRVVRPTPFPIESLAGRPLPPYSPPTPPESSVEDEAQEAMDWTPSQPTLTAPKPYQNPPSPSKPPPRAGFRGHLPPDVVSPAHRLRNPPNQPTFRKASESTKANFFTRRDVDNSKSRETDMTSDSRDSSPAPTVFSDFSPADAKFRDPKLFSVGNEDETGLEGILERAFSLGEPAEVQERRTHQAQVLEQARDQRRRQARVSIILRIFLTMAFLALSYTILFTAPPPQILTTVLARFPPRQLQLFALGIPLVLTLKSVVSATTRQGRRGHAIISVLALSQSVATSLLIATVLRYIDLDGDGQELETWGKRALAGISMLEMVKGGWMYSFFNEPEKQ